jgi:hypothetical protein
MNWPPSRGENNPHEPVEVLYVPGDVQREDVPQAPREAHVLEEGRIEEIQAEGLDLFESMVSRLEEHDEGEPELPEGVVSREDHYEDGGTSFYRRPGWKPKLRPIEGKFSCNYHVETVATLTLQQAVSLIYVRELIGTKQVRRGHGESVPSSILSDNDSQWGRHEFEPRVFSVVIDYPLKTAVRLVVPLMTRKFVWRDEKENDQRTETSPGYLLWVIAREYQRVYREHEKYGVWGHGIGDLWFEGMEVAEDGVVGLWMGS